MRTLVRILLAGLALFLTGAGTTLPAQTDGQDLLLLLTGHYQVRLAGELDSGAKIYRTEGVPRLLIDAPGLGTPWLIVAGEKLARRLPAEAVERVDGQPDAVRVDASAATTEVPIAIEGPSVTFTADRGRVVLEPAEPLLGELEPEELLAALPEYRRGAARFEPGRGELRLLAGVEGPVEVDVFFGSWCPHCEQIVPRIIKLARTLDSPAIRFHFHGLPRKFDDDPLARQYRVLAVPVVLVRRGDRVLSRLEGRVLFRPEQALASALFGSQAG